tara:strand:+ start:259 stop:654 length:396 start_codon:yes stop_codon:yes gene_type:complete
MVKTFLINQHKNLKKALSVNPDLNEVIFQGEPLEFHASNEGLESLLKAYDLNDFDPISLNHSIKRLRINSYNSDLIWDHPKIKSKVNFNDEIINLLEKSYDSIKNVFRFYYFLLTIYLISCNVFCVQLVAT